MLQQIIDFVGQMGGNAGPDTEKRLLEALSGGDGKVEEGEFRELLEGLLAKLEELGIAEGGKDLPVAEQKELLMNLLAQGEGRAKGKPGRFIGGEAMGSGSLPGLGNGPRGLDALASRLSGQKPGAEAASREDSQTPRDRLVGLMKATSGKAAQAGPGQTGPGSDGGMLFRANPGPGEFLAPMGQARGEFPAAMTEAGPRGLQAPSTGGEDSRGGREAASGSNSSSLQGLNAALGGGSESSSAQRLPPIQTPVGQGRAWAQALGQRVTMMQAQGMERAEVRLHPPNLGPLEIRLSMSQEQTQLTLSSQHAVTREALESALPRLREMLQEQGIELGDATVTDGGEPSADTDDDGAAGGNPSGRQQGDDGSGRDAPDSREVRVGLLDEYA